MECKSPKGNCEFCTLKHTIMVIHNGILVKKHPEGFGGVEEVIKGKR
jgi:hypothetical protein